MTDGASSSATERHRVERTHVLPLAAERAFALVADVRTHPRWVPLTRGVFYGSDTATDHAVSTDPGAPVPATRWQPRVGAEFTMVSGPFARQGLPGFRDRMRITTWEPPRDGQPGHAAYLKLGPVLLGEAGIDVVPLAAHRTGRDGDTERRTGRCAVTWWEEVYLAGPLPRRATAPLAGAVLDLMIGTALRTLDRLARQHP